MTSSTVGSVINRGGQTARQMTREAAAEPSVYDVWSHSYDGMSQNMQAFADNPASILSVDTAQLARASAAAMNTPTSSINQIENSMAAQADALGESVSAIGDAQGTLETVGATFAMLTGVEQMLSTVLSAIPFPSLPAVRILDIDIGLPHAHSHPPNLIPPAPPIPLPSIGPVIPIPILSGAMNTLINGMPAGRCGDMGLGIWCGGYFPMYEVFLGSSNVWIEGARAARLLVDITKHCLFTIPKPSDPPLGPMLGTTISASPNVLIGGIPMPSLTSIAIGAALRGAFKLAGKGGRAFSRLAAPLRRRMGRTFKEVSNFVRCKILRAEPVDFITGEIVVEQQDFVLPGIISLAWNRHYASQSTRKGVCGYGWSSLVDARLTVEEDGAAVFDDGLGEVIVFPHLPQQGAVYDLAGGSQLSVKGEAIRVRLKNSLSYVFTAMWAQASELAVQRIEDDCGNFVRFGRDAHGLREITDSAGQRIEVHSRAGLVREIRLRISEHGAPHVLVRYEYSADDELIAVYDAAQNPYRFRYEGRKLVQHTNRTGLSFCYEYDGAEQSARCVRTWGDGGLYSYRFDFDAAVRRVTITNSRGAASTVQLNELHLPSWEIDPLGGITRYEYDDRGRTIAVLDRDGNGVRYEYDDRGNLLKVTRADGGTIQIAYDAASKPVTITDPNGSRWTQSWDSRGLLLERVSPLGFTSRYEYDSRGLLVAFTDAGGGRTELGFDTFGNLTRYIDALGRRTRFAYDALGNLTGKLDPLERKTLYRYDVNNQLIRVQLPTGAAVRCEYDAQGNLVRYVDEQGAETRFEYFGLGRVQRRHQSDGHVVDYAYDTEEQLVAVKNQRGEIFQLQRDALGRVTTEVDYWGQATSYTFDAAGHLKQISDPLGRITHFTTDKLGRIRSKRHADALRPDRFSETSFEFDLAGNLVACSNEHATLKRRFDAEGRLVEEQQNDFVVKNSFDELGALTRRETSAGNVITYSYDRAGQNTAIRINDDAPIAIERDAAGRIRKETLAPSIERFFEYDAQGRLTRQGLRHAARWVADTQYQYDATGNLIARRDAQLGTDLYEYDPLGQVTQHIDPQGKLSRFLHDPVGDRLQTRISTTNPVSREGQYEGVHYQFDATGNLIRRNATQLTWDASNRLVRTETDGVATLYGYDPLGRRASKQSLAEKTRFYWGGDALLAERALEGGWREYVYYPGTFEPLALIETRAARPETFYYYNDPNGCPIRVLSSAGDVVWAASYTAWGEATVVAGNPALNRLRFQGQYADDETGLHYNRNRYYDPLIGQFISPDPIGLNGGSHPYQYARNAFTWTDPLGLERHQLEAWIERDGETLEWTRKELESGGLSKAEAGPWGRNSHTEPKYLKQFRRFLRDGDVVQMRGVKDPCPGGCNPLLRNLVNDMNATGKEITVVYHASETGRIWKFRRPGPNEFPNLKANAVVEVTEADGTVISRRYWKKANGSWSSRKIPKAGCA